MEEGVVKKSSSFTFSEKLKDYKLLIKFSLSFLVVFSAVISYLLAPKVVEYNWYMIILLFLGGMLVTGSANAVNQILEKDTDAKMKRTAGRPVASGRMSEKEAWAFSYITLALGLLIFAAFFNILSAGIALLSWALYAYWYTPMKKKNSLAVFVGAIPGALPCLIGWVAGQDEISAGGWALFGIQFFWQFPHFWAIAWLAHKDYEGAGFRLLPSVEGPTRYSAIQSIMYSMILIPAGMLPYLIGITGITSFYIVLGANIIMVIQSVRLLKEMTPKAARRVMFSSYFYLAIVYFALLADKAL